MNQALKILLKGEGFTQRGRSCEFTKRHESSEVRVYLFRVWLHRDGGQAEVYDAKSAKKLTRMEHWQSMKDLQEFFKEFQ